MGKFGLVLEGGAMRGMFTAGILDVLMEEGITVDGTVGVSAGAVFGCNFKSKQIGRTIRYNMKYCRDPRYCSVRSLIKTGDLFGAAFCYHELPEKLDLFDNETYEQNPMRFYAVCTDVDTGEAVYHECETARGVEIEWLRASASLPLAAQIVTIGGQRLLDGGIADPIPLRFFEEQGYTKNIVVLTRPRGYVKKKNGAMSLISRVFKKDAAFIRAMERRHLVYNEALSYAAQAEKEGRALLLCPETKLPIERTCRDPETLKKVYELGRAEAMRRLDEIRMFLK